MRPSPCTIVLFAAAAAAAQAQPTSCERSFPDPATGNEITLRLRVDSPLDGSHHVRLGEGGCELLVEGWASTSEIPTLFDFYLVLDVSSSTGESSGLDIDGDGSNDSILEVEVAAARDFVQAVGTDFHRIALISFSGRAETVVHLDDPGSLLLPALDALTDIHDGGTSFGDGLKQALHEHLEHPAADREQVVLFLTDGEPYDAIPPPPGPNPPCSHAPPACSGIHWAHELGEQGMTVHAFGVGDGADQDVLDEMADLAGGESFDASSPDVLLEALPGLLLVGIDEVLVENLSTGDSVEASLQPDGRFSESLPAIEGPANELRVVASSSEVPGESLECTLETTFDCILFGCPEDFTGPCAGPDTPVDGLVAWADDPDVTALVFPWRTWGFDGSGEFSVGTTELVWRFFHPLAPLATCNTLVTIVDEEPPTIDFGPPTLVASCDDIPPAPPVVAEDLCDPSLQLFSLETRVNGPCPGNYTLVRTRWARDDSGNESERLVQEVEVRDLEPPTLSDEPADLTVGCDEVPPPAVVSAWDACDPAPSLAFEETRTDGPCPNAHELERRWTAVDHCDNSVSHSQRVTVFDAEPPSLSLPSDLLVECDDPAGLSASHPAVQAWLAAASATDSCGPALLAHDLPDRLPSGCGAGAPTTVTFTATDACGLTSTQARTIRVVDASPPQVEVPAPITLECAEPGGLSASAPAIAAWLASAAASDACGEVSLGHDAPAVFASGCSPDGLVTTVTFTAVDECGLVASAASSITVRDSTAPALTLPAALTLECDGSGGLSRDDPRVQAWLASATATDACGPAAVAHDAPALFPAGCPPGQATRVSFTATDSCGLRSIGSAVLTVVDGLPPEAPSGDADLACLWPPNHRFVRFAREDFAPDLRDACDSGPITWRFVGCASDGPDDGIGDGSTEADCRVAPDGSAVLLRAERSGLRPEGRRYELLYAATDGCGNESAPSRLGFVHVPHDSRRQASCRDSTKEGLRPNEALPF